MLKDTKEFHITCNAIIERLPNIMAGEFWNLFELHRSLWKEKKITFPEGFNDDEIEGRYKYIKDAVIKYKKQQAIYKKTKSFDFVSNDHRKYIPKEEVQNIPTMKFAKQKKRT